MEDLKRKEYTFANDTNESLRKTYLATNDIVWYNFERLNDREIESYDFSMQKEMVEQELRNYIGYKFEELSYPISEEELKEKEIVNLISTLANQLPDNKKEIVDNFTKYIIKIIFKLQGIKIEWKLGEVKECTFISVNDFEFLFLTPKNYNYLDAFYTIWNYFQSKMIDENRKRA